MSQAPNLLRGVFTALVTPFNNDGSLDLGRLRTLVETQLAAGVDGFVPCGTTGEGPTLTMDERRSVIETVVKAARGRVAVIGGAGGNDTRAAIELQKLVRDAGATFALVATPYYNKPTPEGLLRHYGALREAVDIPIVIYNIPGRTGGDMKPEVVGKLFKGGMIAGIKEATGDLTRVDVLRELTSPEFAILSGEDELTLPFVALGGDGVISATSNVAPAEMVGLVKAARADRLEDARRFHRTLRPLIRALFLESNPIPAKAALALMGQALETYRLPLCEMQPGTRAELERVLRAGGWLR